MSLLPEDGVETLRAGMLSEILSEKDRFVLILDDVYERFSLKKVGILESFEGKLVLTSRSLDVCRQMYCQVVKMGPLLKEDAWTLFSDKLNTDGARNPSSSSVSSAAVARYEHGRWICGIERNIDKCNTV
ncbi:hypothetical protein J1N35_021348 [Gossypium stocksii]|uniref:NB-ARC domain-containing protein n=1 Tax=Gossypium stocksii TaxID=47602 RepID=A0A9D3VFJ2_9ROSI|nr:hypothetical protein J1N35_021348 [Gossypium stocksii]